MKHPPIHLRIEAKQLFQKYPSVHSSFRKFLKAYAAAKLTGLDLILAEKMQSRHEMAIKRSVRR